MARFQVGQRVRLARAFLRNTGQTAGDAAFWRGSVVSVRDLSAPGVRRQVVRVAWEDGSESSALSSNLAVIGKPELD